jgi:hypothetical protein
MTHSSSLRELLSQNWRGVELDLDSFRKGHVIDTISHLAANRPCHSHPADETLL